MDTATAITEGRVAAPAEVPAAPKPAERRPYWNPATRILFRFVCVYFTLYIFPFPADFIPRSEVVMQPFSQAVDAGVVWVAEHVFGTEITFRPLGSGDTTWNYVSVFGMACLAVVGTLVWSVVDRKRPAYPRLFQALRVWVRFYLATVMVQYGGVKVIQSQFPHPSLDRLLQPFGDASPMGLLWTFMGASAGYNFFTGAGEMLGGLLLTTRRTTLSGALVSVGVLSNVVALNFCYDVPVKLFSTHLMALALFLVAPDLRRLIDLLVLHRPVDAVEYRPLLPRWRTLRYGVVAVRTLLVLAFVNMVLSNAREGWKRFNDPDRRSPLYGVWTVEEFATNGRSRPPVVTDTDRWRRVAFDYPGMVAVQLMGDARNRYLLNLDAEKKTLSLTKADDKSWKGELTYARPENDVLTLDGTFGDQAVRARLRRADVDNFRLTSRGFHWINEVPFNK